MHETRSIHNNPGFTWERTRPLTSKGPATAGWLIDVVTTESAFDALENDWNELVADSPASIFQTFDWTRTWWKYFGNSRHTELHILVLRRNGEMVAIAPLFTEVISVFGLAKATRLCFIGRKESDYLDIIIRNDTEEEAYLKFADYLGRNNSKWDLIFLEDVPDRSPTHTLLPRTLTRREMTADIATTDQCPRFVLPNSWEQYLANQSKHFRHEIHRRETQMGKLFEAQYETIDEEGIFDTAFADFIDLHQQRWTQAGEPGVFANSTARAFHREVAGKLFARHLVHLSFLKLDGKRTAGSYSFTFGGEFSAYLLGMGKIGKAERFSPGRLLNCNNIRYAIESGKRTFDFMRGTEEYKYQLLGHDEPNRTITIYTHSDEARKIERRRNLNILFESSRCRIAKELTRLHTTVQRNGWFSRETFSYLAHRTTLILQDLRQKTKEPLLPLYLR